MESQLRTTHAYAVATCVSVRHAAALTVCGTLPFPDVCCSTFMAWLLSSPGGTARLLAAGQVLQRAELHRAAAEDLHGGGLARVVDQRAQRVDAYACTRGIAQGH